MWSQAHRELSLALLVERLGEALVVGLGLSSSQSGLAALLEALQADSDLAASLELVEWVWREQPHPGAEDVAFFCQTLLERFPQNLSPRLLHQIALAWRDERGAEPATLRAAGGRSLLSLRALVYLWDRHQDYLREVAERVGAGASSILAEWPFELLSEHYVAIAERDDRGERHRAWRLLLTLERSGRRDGLSRPGLRRLAARREASKALAIERAWGRCETRVGLALEAHAKGAGPVWGKVFEPVIELVDQLGHQAELSERVLRRAVELAWPLHEGKQWQSLTALFWPLRLFIDELESQLKAGRAFGMQGLFSDALVHLQVVTPPGGEDSLAALWPKDREAYMQALWARQSLSRRALAQHPEHRNARLSLANANARLIRAMVLSAQQGEKVKRLPALRALLVEIKKVRPEHSSIVELEQVIAEYERG